MGIAAAGDLFFFFTWNAVTSLWWKDNEKSCVSPLRHRNNPSETWRKYLFPPSQIQCLLTPARLIPSSCLSTTLAAMLSHNHQRVASCLGPTKTERSTSLSCKPPTPAGEHPKPGKHAIVFYVEVKMLWLISAEFVLDGNNMKVDLGGRVLFTFGIFFC